ncbi:unnamed protein product [Owenia fusiformis]|uniref:MAP kinase-activating death domain protein n=1 Tax=Owenia fusiformis TaxID=6347 RepID=A0A8S4NXM8_OWEFU|nr:unnamed protein product [Owenia fusiformis]
MEENVLCPRLLDYVVFVGSKEPSKNNTAAQTPELLRRYPVEDHKDFALPPDVVFFCQPEGCINVGPKQLSLRESTSFVFTLTEKDSGICRFGICVNFYRPFEKKRPPRTKNNVTRQASVSSNEQSVNELDNSFNKRSKTIRNHTLTSVCFISHHPFFSTFRETVYVLRQIIEACNERSCNKRIGGSKFSSRDTVWGVLSGQGTDSTPSLVMHEVREIETWILRLLSAPVPVPGKTKVQLEVMNPEVMPALLFALPDHTRFPLVDFPLHLPLELLGVDTCLRVLSCIILEHKIVLMSRDYNALTMSVMAFVSMLYPLEYMFPVIPLLPTCMSSAEQLLLAPTPYIIGVPASFFLYKKGFRVPDDVWLVDLDSNKIQVPRGADELPSMPEPELSILKNHLKQALASMCMSPQPIKNLDALTQNPDSWQRKDNFTSPMTGFNPLIYGNDVDSVDIATRVAMVRFFNSPNILCNFTEHTRTLRLYPRPVVAFQTNSFLKSRVNRTMFTAKLARTQAVEYYAEWALCPKKVVYLRVQTGVFDPLLIGDKPKWYSNQLQTVHFKTYDEFSTLAAAITAKNDNNLSDENPTDESGSDSDGALSSSSSYSSLGDFVTDIVNSDINGDTPDIYVGGQALTIDESSVFCPPRVLQLPDGSMSTSDSAYSQQDSDSSRSSSPVYATETSNVRPDSPTVTPNTDIFNYDTSIVTPTVQQLGRSDSRVSQSSKLDSPSPKTPPPRPAPPVLRSQNSAFDNVTPRDPSLAPEIQRQGSVSPLPQSRRGPGSRANSRDGERPDTPNSLISNLSSELTDVAQAASSTFSDLFVPGQGQGSSNHSSPSPSLRNAKPFAPLGSRKALVEKSGLVKHASSRKQQQQKQATMDRTNVNSENQQFLKEVLNGVMEGQGVSWWKLSKVKKLMEDENYRAFVVSRLNTSLDKKLTDEDAHLEDVQVTRSVFKGILAILKAVITGLEHTYQNQGLGGMASMLMVLEIAHTHYWLKEVGGSNRSDHSGTSQTSSPFGSRESLRSDDLLSPQKSEGKVLETPDHQEKLVPSIGSPVLVNGDEYQNIELRVPTVPSNNNQPTEPNPLHPSVTIHNSDILSALVKNKELIDAKRKELLAKFSSQDSDLSEATLVSLASDTLSRDGSESSLRSKARINHHSIRTRSVVSDSELEMPLGRKKRSPSVWSSKSSVSTGFRFHDGNLINTSGLAASPDGQRTYIFQHISGKERSLLWDQMQFWEDAFLDAVAQERDIIGMDQGPGEMMERYNSLGDSEKKRLEHDEDRLLAVMLYNMVAFMIMMRCNKVEIKKKIRRLLGKSHIGLAQSQEVNDLLDQINNLHGNDIDLQPVGSRMMQKLSFTVHWGPDNTGDMLFMEVCDDCIILRSVTGAICDRWWYEKLINMTYCPKTKVLCLWRKQGDSTQLNKFYTKKCRELYFAVKESMEKAAARTNGKIPGPELGGEFPVQDMKSGQGGLLQVCMEGIGLLFANSKYFIELSRIKKCYTHRRGGIFVIEELDAKTQQVIHRKYKTSMAYAVNVCECRLDNISEMLRPHGRPDLLRSLVCIFLRRGWHGT